MQYTIEQLAFALANFVKTTLGDDDLGTARLDDRLVAVYGGRSDQARQCIAEFRQELKSGRGVLCQCFREAAYSPDASGEVSVLLLQEEGAFEGSFDFEGGDDDTLAVVEEALEQAWADARRAVLAEGGPLSARELGWEQVQTAWLDALLPHAAEVEADLAGLADARRAFVGSGFAKALDYLDACGREEARLVHGQVTSPGRGARFASAWVELPGGIVYDPMTERHFRRERFYTVLEAAKEAEYDRRGAANMVVERESFGPWHEG